MLTRTQKEEQVAELKEKFGRATSVYVVGFRGLDVESANALRRRVRTEGDGDFEYRVAKNSVLKLASVDSDCSAISSHFVGPTSVAISYGDPVGLAKILSEFAKDNQVFELKAKPNTTGIQYKGGTIQGDVRVCLMQRTGGRHLGPL